MNIGILAEYLGPNLYLPVAAIRLRLEMGELAGVSSKSLGDEFIQGVLDKFPAFNDPSAMEGVPFTERLKGGCDLAQVVVQIIIALQNMAGISTSHAQLVEDAEPGCYQILYACSEPGTGVTAARLATIFLEYLLPRSLQQPDGLPPGFKPEVAIRNFLQQTEQQTLGDITRLQLRKAEERNIPWFRPSPASRVVQLGHGKYRRLFQGTLTTNTNVVSCIINRSKTATLDMLRPLGLPVPTHVMVSSEAQAQAAAKRLGFPLVIKPVSGYAGQGISVGIDSIRAVVKAYRTAVKHAPNVVVEEFIPGHDHRILVVNNSVIAVAQRMPAQVVGDGQHTIKELVEQINHQQNRGSGSQYSLVRIELDARCREMLRARGHRTDSVPAADEVVALAGTANMSTGGTAIDCTELIHHENRAMAERAVRIIGLNIAGVDFITPDISRSWKEVGGAICEVNDSVGLRPHWQANPERDVLGPILDTMMPPGTDGRIPTAAITGTSGKTTTAGMVARILQTAGYSVGLASTSGVYINNELVRKGDLAGGTAARAVLMDPDVDAAVLETARGGLIQRGIAYGKCDVGAVLNISGDHLGEHGIETLEDLARVKALVAGSASEWVVLNADDALCVAMAADATAKRVCFVSCDRSKPLVREHLAAAGRAVIIDYDKPGMPVSVLEADTELAVLAAADIPATFAGTARFNCTNALFAVAIAYCMKQSPEHIRQALLGFTTSYGDTPGRANVYDEHPFTVVVDNAHNPDKLAALTAWMRRLYPQRRRILVMTIPGNRQDGLYTDMAAAAAGHYDHYICSRWGDNPRGRDILEVQQFLQSGLQAKGVAAGDIFVAETEEGAISHALDLAEPDDVVVLCCKDYEQVWELVRGFPAQ